MAEAGRPSAAVGIDVFLPIRAVSPDRWAEYARDWRELGVSDLSVDVLGAGCTTLDEHRHVLQHVAEELAVSA